MTTGWRPRQSCASFGFVGRSAPLEISVHSLMALMSCRRRSTWRSTTSKHYAMHTTMGTTTASMEKGVNSHTWSTTSATLRTWGLPTKIYSRRTKTSCSRELTKLRTQISQSSMLPCKVRDASPFSRRSPRRSASQKTSMQRNPSSRKSGKRRRRRMSLESILRRGQRQEMTSPPCLYHTKKTWWWSEKSNRIHDQVRQTGPRLVTDRTLSSYLYHVNLYTGMPSMPNYKSCNSSQLTNYNFTLKAI